MTRLATSWLVYRLTGSAFLLGVVGFAGQIPTFIFAPFAGVGIDRLDRRQVLLVTQILAMLQSLALTQLATRTMEAKKHVLIAGFGRSGQRLAKLLRLEIEVRSEVGRGSAFTIVLPAGNGQVRPEIASAHL